MINSIMDGITVRLDEVFGYTIYDDDIKQGYEEPCFYVTQVKVKALPELGTRTKRNTLFDIHFFGENSRQLREVEQKFLDNFRVLTLPNGELIHGTDLNTEIEDGVLHCFVNYNLFAEETQEHDYMDGMEIGAYR